MMQQQQIKPFACISVFLNPEGLIITTSWAKKAIILITATVTNNSTTCLFLMLDLILRHHYMFMTLWYKSNINQSITIIMKSVTIYI